MLQTYFYNKAMNGEALKPFSTLVVYQDADARREAQQLLERLVDGVMSRFDFKATWTGLEDLAKDAEKREAALENAVDAALIIFSVRFYTTSFPKTVRQWMDTWLPAKQKQGSGLVLMGHPTRELSDNSRNIHRYLREAARRGRMDFLYRFEGAPLWGICPDNDHIKHYLKSAVRQGQMDYLYRESESDAGAGRRARRRA